MFVIVFLQNLCRILFRKTPKPLHATLKENKIKKKQQQKQDK